MIAVCFLLLLQDIGSLSSLGAAAMREKRYEEAVRIYTEAVAVDRENPMWRMNLGLALAYSGRHREAIGELARFLKARPSPGPAHFISGLSLLKLGRHCDAIPLLEAARKWKASSEILVELGDAYQGCQRWELAAAAYQDAARGAAPGQRLPRQTAHCWWMARRYDKAIAIFARLGSAYHEDPEFLFEYGDSLARAQGAQAGLPWLEKAVAADPRSVAAQGALGRALMDLGRAADALPHLEAAAGEDPAVLYSLSRAYSALGRAADAARAQAEYKAKMSAGR